MKDLRYVKNIQNYKRHIVNEDKREFTLCGQWYGRVGFTPPNNLTGDYKIDCKSCLTIYDKL